MGSIPITGGLDIDKLPVFEGKRNEQRVCSSVISPLLDTYILLDQEGLPVHFLLSPALIPRGRKKIGIEIGLDLVFVPYLCIARLAALRKDLVLGIADRNQVRTATERILGCPADPDVNTSINTVCASMRLAFILTSIFQDVVYLYVLSRGLSLATLIRSSSPRRPNSRKIFPSRQIYLVGIWLLKLICLDILDGIMLA